MIPLLSALALACERPPRAPALGFFPFPSPMLLGSKTVGSGWDGLPHRYWRVHSTANGGASQTAILELEMYESEFGADVCTGGTAFASSEVTSGGTFSASRGFDGSLSDFVGSVSTELCWAGNTTNEWLAYDFGAGVTKSVVAIGMHARQSSFVTQVPTTFSVDFSDDGSTWTQAWSVTGISWGGFEFKRFVNPSWSEPSYTGSPFGAHVYWRAYFQTTVSGGTTAPSIAEIENHATPGGTDQSNSGTAAASSIFSGSFPASNAYDNNASTLWSAASGAGQGWVRYQHPSAVKSAELKLTARNDSTVGSSPGAFAWQFADSASGPWTTAWAQNAIAAWTLGQSRTYTDPNYI